MPSPAVISCDTHFTFSCFSSVGLVLPEGHLSQSLSGSGWVQTPRPTLFRALSFPGLLFSRFQDYHSRPKRVLFCGHCWWAWPLGAGKSRSKRTYQIVGWLADLGLSLLLTANPGHAHTLPQGIRSLGQQVPLGWVGTRRFIDHTASAAQSFPLWAAQHPQRPVLPPQSSVHY